MKHETSFDIEENDQINSKKRTYGILTILIARYCLKLSQNWSTFPLKKDSNDFQGRSIYSKIL